jgi:hypothetical protein
MEVISILWVAATWIIWRPVLTFLSRIVTSNLDIMLEWVLVAVDHGGNVCEDGLDLRLLVLVETRGAQKL